MTHYHYYRWCDWWKWHTHVQLRSSLCEEVWRVAATPVYYVEVIWFKDISWVIASLFYSAFYTWNHNAIMLCQCHPVMPLDIFVIVTNDNVVMPHVHTSMISHDSQVLKSHDYNVSSSVCHVYCAVVLICTILMCWIKSVVSQFLWSHVMLFNSSSIIVISSRSHQSSVALLLSSSLLYKVATHKCFIISRYSLKIMAGVECALIVSGRGTRKM